MPDITIKRLNEMECYTGPFQKGQQFFFAGKSLSLTKLGMALVSPGRIRKRSLPIFSLPNPAGWEWGLPSCDQSWKHTAAIWEQGMSMTAARSFSSACRGDNESY